MKIVIKRAVSLYIKFICASYLIGLVMSIVDIRMDGDVTVLTLNSSGQKYLVIVYDGCFVYDETVVRVPGGVDKVNIIDEGDAKIGDVMAVPQAPYDRSNTLQYGFPFKSTAGASEMRNDTGEIRIKWMIRIASFGDGEYHGVFKPLLLGCMANAAIYYIVYLMMACIRSCIRMRLVRCVSCGYELIHAGKLCPECGRAVYVTGSRMKYMLSCVI